MDIACLFVFIVTAAVFINNWTRHICIPLPRLISEIVLQQRKQMYFPTGRNGRFAQIKHIQVGLPMYCTYEH